MAPVVPYCVVQLYEKAHCTGNALASHAQHSSHAINSSSSSSDTRPCSSCTLVANQEEEGNKAARCMADTKGEERVTSTEDGAGNERRGQVADGWTAVDDQ